MGGRGSKTIDALNPKGRRCETAQCAGWRASSQLALQLPDAFIPNSVGCRFEL
jgi:hypothetical protein